MAQFFQKHKVSQFTQYKMDNVTSSVAIKEIELVIKYSLSKNLQAHMISL